MLSSLSKLCLVVYLSTSYVDSYKFVSLQLNRYRSLTYSSNLYSNHATVLSSTPTASSSFIGHQNIIVPNLNNNKTVANDNSNQKTKKTKTAKRILYTDHIEFLGRDIVYGNDSTQKLSLNTSQIEKLRGIVDKTTWTGPQPERHGKSYTKSITCI